MQRGRTANLLPVVLTALITVVVIGGAAWGGWTLVQRFRVTSSGQPQPAPPTDKIENAPGPDNRITDAPPRSEMERKP